MEHAETAGNKIIFSVWFGLLGLTVFEVILAYQELPLGTMLSILMVLSVVKAALIIAYFMHLRYELPSLFVTLIPALVFVLIMMTAIFADSSRLAHMPSLVR
ncbi:MAG: cytochrome C oxidase subunit IV family protein [Candidatus Sulfotelmatobacter sp.]|jgi:cytochrome c oxidase subunit 4